MVLALLSLASAWLASALLLSGRVCPRARLSLSRAAAGAPEVVVPLPAGRLSRLAERQRLRTADRHWAPSAPVRPAPPRRPHRGSRASALATASCRFAAAEN